MFLTFKLANIWFCWFVLQLCFWGAESFDDLAIMNLYLYCRFVIKSSRINTCNISTEVLLSVNNRLVDYIPQVITMSILPGHTDLYVNQMTWVAIPWWNTVTQLFCSLPSGFLTLHTFYVVCVHVVLEAWHVYFSSWYAIVVFLEECSIMPDIEILDFLWIFYVMLLFFWKIVLIWFFLYYIICMLWNMLW